MKENKLERRISNCDCTLLCVAEHAGDRIRVTLEVETGDPGPGRSRKGTYTYGADTAGTLERAVDLAYDAWTDGD